MSAVTTISVYCYETWEGQSAVECLLVDATGASLKERVRGVVDEEDSGHAG